MAEEREPARPMTPEEEEQASLAPEMRVREEDLEPHGGLRYIARLFKVLAILLLLLLVAEVVIGLLREGRVAIPTLLVEATRLIVFAGFLWGAGDMALMLIESNHDLRALRILVGRLNGRVQRVMQHQGIEEDDTGGRGGTPPPPDAQRRDIERGGAGGREL